MSYRDKQGISEAENGEKTENLAGPSGQKPQQGKIHGTRETENARFIGVNARKNQKANPERVAVPAGLFFSGIRKALSPASQVALRKLGAPERSRTSTPLLAQGPEPCVSAISPRVRQKERVLNRNFAQSQRFQNDFLSLLLPRGRHPILQRSCWS